MKKKDGGEPAVLFYWNDQLRQFGADRFGLRVIVQNIVAHLAAPSGLFVSAEGQRRVEDVVAVDPHRAGAQQLGSAVGLADVARPDGGSQAVFAVVGARHNFLGIVERHRRHHRPEDFFPHDFHVFASVHENGGLDEISFVTFLVPPVTALAPSEKPASRYPQTRLSCSSETSGPMLRLGIEAGADIDFLRMFGNAFHDSVEDRLLDVEARSGAAALAVIEEDRARGPGDGCVEISVLETTLGDLPPSSSDTFFKLPAAAWTISLPTSVEPVKAILSTSG